MEEKKKKIANTCSFAGIRPIMIDLPYPPIQVCEENRAYANLLSIDYCGSVSEMSAITQYINNENRLSCWACPMAKTILGIAMAEMMHLQKLGELIFLLGGKKPDSSPCPIRSTARHPGPSLSPQYPAHRSKRRPPQ